MQGAAPLVSRTATQILWQATLQSGEVLDVATVTSWMEATDCAHTAACGDLFALGDTAALGSTQSG
eukprot:10256899-Ditylum_brightwellii.AAC.1